MHVGEVTGSLLVTYDVGRTDEKALIEMLDRHSGGRPPRPARHTPTTDPKTGRALAGVILHVAVQAAIERSLLAAAAALL